MRPIRREKQVALDKLVEKKKKKKGRYEKQVAQQKLVGGKVPKQQKKKEEVLYRLPVAVEEEDTRPEGKVYYNPSESAGYAGASRLAKHFPLSAKEWLKSQAAYTLHKPMLRRFPTRKYRSSGVNDIWQMDLMEMIPYASINKKHKYILTCVDVFSRFARAIPIQSKDGLTVATAISKMFTKDICPSSIQTDKGKEFYNPHVRDLFARKGINHYSVNSQFKAALVERFNRTLRERMNRFFTHTGEKVWIEALPKIIGAYNKSSHRGLGGKRPIDITNDLDTWLEQEKTDGGGRGRKKPYKVGSFVRISRISASDPFRKNFDQNWSEEVYEIVAQDTREVPIMYVIKDLNGEILQGKFYHQELQVIKRPDLYRIEAILGERVVNKHKQYLVKWVGYDNSHNSWINQWQTTFT